ncbi:MAG TPA: glycosyltransferase family 39 protein, partial [Polyangiaceae bacterium]|nr:glycosyltransferase family 39 protein [Polyangiaceae bacterium]
MPPDTKERNKNALLLLALIALALAARLPGIAASFYGDEGFSLLRDSKQLLTPTEDRFRPLYFSLLYLWRTLGFHGEFALRSLSLLFGVLQIPVGYKLAERLGGARAGLVFALLLALDPMLIEFSQELRMYSLVPLVALLQAWAFVEVVARHAEGRPVLGAWVGFVLAGVVGVYTHFHYWFLIAGFAFAMLRRRRDLPLKQGIIALAATVLLYLPNLPNLMRFQREAGGAPHLLATDLPSALPKLLVACSVGFNYFV